MTIADLLHGPVTQYNQKHCSFGWKSFALQDYVWNYTAHFVRRQCSHLNTSEVRSHRWFHVRQEEAEFNWQEWCYFKVLLFNPSFSFLQALLCSFCLSNGGWVSKSIR